jgi:hypothetical protein
VLTEDLNFFYKINKELNLLKIKFKVLNLWNKLPRVSSIIITTSEEIEKISNIDDSLNKILAYSKEEDFDIYFLRVLAAHRVGFKRDYSELTFSIDPGTKRIGLAVFLDDFYLDSHTCYEENELLKRIENYVNFIPSNSNKIRLNFKFGRGILPEVLEFVTDIFKLFNNRKDIKFYLIDEYKSSKIKIPNKKKKMSKDEISALILALRDGLEVNQKNYIKVIKDLKFNKLNEIEENFTFTEDFSVILIDIIMKMINGEYSLSKSVQILKAHY